MFKELLSHSSSFTVIISDCTVYCIFLCYCDHESRFLLNIVFVSIANIFSLTFQTISIECVDSRRSACKC